MDNSVRSTRGRRPATLLAALVFLTASAIPALAQATKPQTSPAPTVHTGHGTVSETSIDAKIPDDSAVEKMLAVYAPKVRELDVIIGNLKGELRKGGTGAGSLGNFVTDGMRWEAQQKSGNAPDLALMNAGGLRRTAIGEGKLRVRDIFELLPFENALVTVELNGEQLKRLLNTILTSNEAQSGAHIVYRQNADKKNEALSIKLRTPQGERDIDSAAIYTVVTIDYLYNVGGKYGILKEGKNMKALGVTLRDALMNYVRAETAAGRDIKANLDRRFSTDGPTSEMPDSYRR